MLEILPAITSIAVTGTVLDASDKSKINKDEKGKR